MRSNRNDRRSIRAGWFLVVAIAMASGIAASPLRLTQNLAPRFSPSSAPYDTRFEPRELTVELPPTGGPYTVEVELPGNNGPRTITLEDRGDGRFTAKAPLFEQRAGPARLDALATYPTGSLAGEIADREVRVAGRTYKLSEIGWVDQQRNPLTALMNNSVIPGSLESGAIVSFKIGSQQVEMDLASAQRVELYPLGPRQGQAAYTVIVRRNNEVISRTEGSVIMTEGPAETSTARALAAPPVQRPPLTSDRISVKLPAPADDVVLGGGGRYLIFQLHGLRQLAVFDVNAGAITRTLPLPSDNVKIAAGLEKLVVLLTDTRQIQRWDLRAMEREFTETLALPDAPVGLAMGYASHGPVMVMTRRGPVLLELGKFGELIDASDDSNWERNPSTAPIETRAAANGEIFTGWEGNARGGQGRILIAEATGIRTGSSRDAVPFEIVPSSDGSMLFTPGGVYSSAYVKIDEDPLFNLQTFPTVSPAFFAAIRPPDPSAAAASSAIPPPTRGAFGTSAGVAPTLSVYSMSDRRQLASIPNLTELTGALDRRPGAPPTGPRGGFQLGPQGSTTDASLPLDKRVFLIPAADVLITVSSTRDELIVRKLDLMAEIERAKVPYLFITSVPPHDVQRGQLYRYPISVKSGSGSVTFKLESGPAGMWISPEGLVTWLPAPSAAPRSRVIVSARDRAGLEVYHDFTIEAR